MRRRQFLAGSAIGLANLIAVAQARMARARAPSPREVAADVAIIGGGLGGCAAALAALQTGRTVVLTEPTDWIGGQLTAQATPPDEHPWIEQFGANASYRMLRQRIRDEYRQHYPLNAEARERPDLNPGNGSVSRLCVEPRVALAVLTAMLAPHASAGRLTVLLEHEPVAAEVDGDRIRAVTVKDRRTGDLRTLTAPLFLDATELGDLLPLAGVEHVAGAESRDQTGEPHAADEPRPADQQAFTCPFVMEYRAGEDHTIDRPDDYAFWRDFVPALSPPWPGRLFGPYSYPVDPSQSRPFVVDPTGQGAGLWAYRRIIDPRNFRDGAYPGPVTAVNWPQNDYLLGNLVGVTPEEATRHVSQAKSVSLSLLYWLQTEYPRPDGGTGWKGLRLRPDLVGTDDGLTKHPYIRESRRIQAEFTILEQHVATATRPDAATDARAEPFADSVGIGSYRIDLHPSTGGSNYIDISSLPFQVPLGSLVPVRMENLVPACKNIGTTHITNGCYRLHPVEWAIGEAAGALAAYCLEHRTMPRAVRNTPKSLASFQARLVARGVELNWPRLTPR